ncbi:MAG: succinate dehydrogenase/fumarate reductase flavoprotein subunit, partial [Chloroflexota bacterium]
AGLRAAEYALGASYTPLPADPTEYARQQFDAIRSSRGEEKAFTIGNEMKAVMFDDVGVFRTEQGMQRALDKVRELRQRLLHVRTPDPGKVFNTELINTWELGNLLELAEMTTVSAMVRQESRGGHAREDFPKRDDVNWLKHTLAWMDKNGVRLGYKPVTITKYQPKERVY